MKKLKLLCLLPALLTLSSCSLYDKESVKTPLDWCISKVLVNTVSIDGEICYEYIELNTNFKEQKEIVKGYLITTYCYEQNYDNFVKTEWICGIGFTGYYGIYEWKVVHISNIEWIDCDEVNKTICNEGKLELL